MRRLCALILLLVSCGRAELSADYGLCLDTRQQVSYFPQSVDSDVDILLVLDSSPAMQAQADAVAQSLPRMVEALRSQRLNNYIPDVHIGVISADLGAGDFSAAVGCSPGGDGGRLLHAPRVPGCTPPTDPWIRYTDGTTNIPAGAGDPIARVGEALRCIGTLGHAGCRFSQPLEAARRALDPALGLNPGFLRKATHLTLVFITAGDDCSAARPQLFDPSLDLGPPSSFRCFEYGIQCDVKDPAGPRTNCKPGHDWLRPTQDHVAFFKELVPAGQVQVLVISGPTKPVAVVTGPDGAQLAASCHTAVGMGTPAIRLEAFARGFGNHGSFNEGTDASQSQDIPVSICSADYVPAARLILRQIPSDGGTQCLRGYPVTRDCALACTPDLTLGGGASCGNASCLERADCVVYEQIWSLDRTSVLARCPTALFNDPMNAKCGASCPCWRLVARTGWCSPSINGSPISFEVLRDRPAPRGAVAVVKCETTTHAPGSPGLQALPRCDPAR